MIQICLFYYLFKNVFKQWKTNFDYKTSNCKINNMHPYSSSKYSILKFHCMFVKFNDSAIYEHKLHNILDEFTFPMSILLLNNKTSVMSTNIGEWKEWDMIS